MLGVVATAARGSKLERKYHAHLTLGAISGSADDFARAGAVFTRCGAHLLVARARR